MFQGGVSKKNPSSFEKRAGVQVFLGKELAACFFGKDSRVWSSLFFKKGTGVRVLFFGN